MSAPLTGKFLMSPQLTDIIAATVVRFLPVPPVEEVVGHSMMSAAVEGKPRRDIAWMTFMENTTASPLSLV